MGVMGVTSLHNSTDKTLSYYLNPCVRLSTGWLSVQQRKNCLSQQRVMAE